MGVTFTSGKDDSKIILHPRQKVALVIVASSSLIASLKLLLSLPDFVLYAAVGVMLLGVLVFVLPFAYGGLQRSLRIQAGQKVFEFFDKAGLAESDMRRVLARAKEGYKIGFGQDNEPPYYQVLLTVQKFEGEEQPRQEDYWPWEEALEYLENLSDDGE